MTDLLTLADRVQALTSACRETDEDIALAVGYRAWGGAHLKGYGLNYCEPSGKYIGAPPKFTALFDCAISLVPADMEWEAGTAKLMDIGWARVVAIHDQWKSKAATPTLALTAASLRARAALENSNG